MPEQKVKDFNILCKALEALYTLSEKLWRNYQDLDENQLSLKTRGNHYELVSRIDLLKSHDLYVKIGANSNTLQLDLKNFLLPPLKKKSEFIPLLSFKCDLNGSLPYTSLRIKLFRFTKATEENNGSTVNTPPKRHLKGLGFRFETGDTEHNYCHVQLISIPGSLDKLPENYPCIPTTAGCPVSLFLCMVISFYGTSIWTKYFSNIQLELRHKERLKEIFT